MQKPFAFSPAYGTSRNFISTGGQISIAAFVAVIMLIVIICMLFSAKHVGSDATAPGALSSDSELTTGMPLP